MKPFARFIGTQMTEREGVGIALYNVEGDHERRHSTVDVMTLVHNGIAVPGMTRWQVARAYLRSAAYYWLGV